MLPVFLPARHSLPARNASHSEAGGRHQALVGGGFLCFCVPRLIHSFLIATFDSYLPIVYTERQSYEYKIIQQNYVDFVLYQGGLF